MFHCTFRAPNRTAYRTEKLIVSVDINIVMYQILDEENKLTACAVSTVGTESIQTPLNVSLFVSLQPFAQIKKVHFISH